MKTLRSIASVLALCGSAGLVAQSNTWVQKSDIGLSVANGPNPRLGAASFSIGNKGYVVGGNMAVGYFLADLWEYDPTTDTWTQRASFPGPARTDAVGFSIGSKGYVAAGYNNTYLNDVWEYDPLTDAWTAKAPLPGLGRCDAAVFVIGAQAYVTTGRNGANMSDTWQYDQATNSWTSKAVFPGTARAYATGFSVGGLGYVGGGSDGTMRSEMWAYDPVANSWSAKANVPVVCRESIAFALGSKGYLGHGKTLSGSNTIAMGLWYEYDPSANTWTQRAAYGTRYSGFGFAINGRGYVGGGHNSGFNVADGIWQKTFAEYDPVSDTWATKARFGASVTMSAASCALGGKGYVQGGGNTSTTARDAWEYDPITNEWTLLPHSVNVSLTTGFGIGTKAYRGTGYANYVYQSSLFAYDTITESATLVSSFGGGGRVRAAAFTIGGKAYLGTGIGSNPSGYRKDIWEYDPAANAWTQKANFGGTGRYNAVAFSIGGKGYLGLGRDSTGLRNDLWSYDPITNVWSPCAAFPGAVRSGAFSFTIGTIAYVCGGKGAGTNEYFNDLWAYDAVLNMWAQKASLPGAARSSAPSFAIDGTGYIAAGEGAGNSVNGGWLKDTWAYTGESVVLRLSPKVFLEGPYVQAQTNMNDVLRMGGLIPLVEPYTANGLIVSVAPYASTTSTVLAITGMNAIVDFVLVELRDPAVPSNVLASKAALVQRDGDVVALDGVSPVSFIGITGSYRVAVRHRNHLGVMTSGSVPLSTFTTTIDFTDPATATYGTNAQKQVGSKMVMWAGDATGNGTIAYTGANNDRDPILIAVGGTTPNNTLGPVYDRRDVNMDGVIKYTGANNDRDPILVNIGGTVPTNTRTQQLP